MQANQLVTQIQERYMRELTQTEPNQMPYFVGFVHELTDDQRLAAVEGAFAVWMQVDQTPHLMTVQLVDGTFEVQGVPQKEFVGVNPLVA